YIYRETIYRGRRGVKVNGWRRDDLRRGGDRRKEPQISQIFADGWSRWGHASPFPRRSSIKRRLSMWGDNDPPHLRFPFAYAAPPPPLFAPPRSLRETRAVRTHAKTPGRRANTMDP